MNVVLKCLSNAEPKSLSVAEYKGLSVGIDVSAWLLKALIGGSDQLVDLQFKDYMLYVDFILARTRNFRLSGVEPVMVFEGRKQYMKSESKQNMDEARQISFEQGQRLLTSMQSTFDTSCKCKLRHEAIVCFQKGLKVTRLVEENCIAALKSLDVTVIIAPYSAAAQLAHLCQIGMCHAVISENSSVLAYSAVTGIPMPILYNFENSGMVNQCDIRTLGIVSDSQQQIQSHNALQKLDTNQLQDACQCIGNNDLKELFRHGSNGDNARLFIQFFIIAGYGSFCDAICDISTSELLQIFVMFKTADHNNRLVLIADHLKNKLQYKSISMSYVDKLRRAEVAYYYQRVYNPLSKTFCYLVDPPVTNTKITNLQANPFVDSVELQKLNAHINNLMDRLSRDGNIEYSQICEGDYSEKTLQFITPRFPWDNVELIRPPITADLSIRKHGVWVTRGNLMRSISGRRIPAPSTPAKETPSHHSQQSSESLDKSKLTDVHTTLPQNTYSNQISDSKLILSSTPVLSTNGNFSASERTPPDIYASQISKNQETQNISPEDCRRLITFPKSQEQNPVVIDSGKDESISVHKRKHYDSVAITVGGGKKQKKTLKLASIKSYFTVPVNKDLNS